MLKKLTFQPGVNKEGTDYSAEGGWYSSDLVRFRKGRPEKLGGWTKLSNYTVSGICRKMHNWSALDSSDYMALGTSDKVYIELGGAFYDVTPTYFTKTSALTADINSTTPTIPVVTGDGLFADDDLIKIDNEYLIVDSISSNELTVVNSGGGSPERIPQFNTSSVSHIGVIPPDSEEIFGPRIVHGFPPAVPTYESTLGVIGIVDGSNDILIRFPAHPGALGKFLNVLQLGATVSAGIVNGDILASSGLKISKILGADNIEVTTGGTGVTANTTLSASALLAGAATVVVSSGSIFVEDDFVKVGGEYIQLGPTADGGVTFTSCTRAVFGSSDVEHPASSPIAKVELKCPASGGNTYIIFDINSGSAQASSSAGWGMSSWGSGVWDDADFELSDFALWSLDNWGENLVGSPQKGEMYYWSKYDKTSASVPLTTGVGSGTPLVADSVPNSQMVPLSEIGNSNFDGHGSVPTSVSKMMVYPNSEMIVAFGCNGVATPFDPMLIRHSDQTHVGSWDPTITNAADGNPIFSGSYIISAARAKLEILVWTDESVYRMKLSGVENEVFSYIEIADGVSIVGPNAFAQAGNAVYWMDTNNFYMYDGNVSILPCTVLNYVFDDIDYAQRSKIFAARNAEFNEISFFYPRDRESEGSTGEPDKYVSYNYAENVWTVGDLSRTAWSDSGIRSNPEAAYISDADESLSLVYVHEDGWDADGSAMNSYIESGYFDIDDGEHFSFISRIIPDVYFEGDGSTLGLEIYRKEFPFSSADTSPATATFTVGTGQVNLRVRGRQAAIRFKSDTIDVGWRLGDMRIDIRPDGRR